MVLQKSVSKWTPQTNNGSENQRGYRLGTVGGKTNCHWGFKPGSRVHQPHTCNNTANTIFKVGLTFDNLIIT
jgi:hypothetical protein